MSGMSAHATKVNQLVNLLARGRTLHYENARKLIRLPVAMSARADLVYRAMQITAAFVLMEQRNYLDGNTHDAFTDAVFAKVSGPHADRVMRLVEGYARVYGDPGQFASICARDLSAALCGEVRTEFVNALGGAPQTVVKMTELYVAQVFSDQELIRARS